MLLKNTALLLVAAVLVLDIIPATYGQEASAEDTGSRLQRQRAQAARRTKLFEAQQQQQQEKVSAVAGAAAGSAATRRRLVSKTRVGGRASTTAAPTTTTTEAPTTAPPTEAPIAVTEEQQRFTDFSSFVDSNVEDDDPEVEDEEIQFRPRATAAPVVVARTTPKAPVTATTRRPVSRPVVIALDDEEEESDPQPLPVQRQRPVAGPVRSRVQEQARPSVESIPRDTNAPALVKPAGGSSRTRTTEKPEIVETVRRYSFESDDGSFTFGYENADGSFKEETRRPDCIVIGKYGYIDPDGIKREFTYQTGNQCDPDAHKRQESSAEEEEEDEEDEAPVRRPNVPARRPVNTPRPSVAASSTRRPNIPDFQTVRRPVVQQQQQTEENDESAEIAQVLNTPTRISRPQTVSQPERSRPVAQPTARPAARPSSSSLNLESELDRLTGVQPQRRPIFNDDDDEEAFTPRRPVQQQVQQQQAPVFQPAVQPQVQPFRQFIQPGSDLGNNPIRSFTSELVFDPRTNQFTSAFQQRIPETNEEINISGNLGGFVFNPQTTTTPSPLRAEFTPQLQLQRPAAPVQQQQQNFFGPSVEDQERIRQQQEAQRQQEETQRIQLEQQRIAQENAASRARPAAQFPAGVGPFQSQQQQPFFGVAPVARTPVSIAQRPTFATGQIDQFLSSLG